MLSVKTVLCGYFLILIINHYGYVNAQLQCYVCTGCQDVVEDDLHYCDVEGSGEEPNIPDPDESDSGDPNPVDPDGETEDSNGSEDVDDDPVFRAGPMGPNTDSVIKNPDKTNPVNTDIADDDVTEGGEFIVYKASPHVVLRGLKQFRDDEEQSHTRCLVVWYEDPETSESNVFRGCSYEPNTNEDRCRNAVGEGITNIEICRVCDENGCNAAGKSAAVVLLLVIGVVINVFV